MIREAVLASCAVPGIFPPVALAARDEDGNRVEFLRGNRWLDGSLTGDLPVKRLARLYGVNHTIVSQTNPLVLPFVDADKDPSGAVGLARQTGLSMAKNFSLAASRLWRRPLSTTKLGRTVVNGFISLASQSYTGDITILPRERVTAYNPLGWLSEKSLKQVKALINGGERATWPVIERIRNQTMISRELDRILQQYDHDFMHKKPTRKAVKKRSQS
jgi:NTE family protein